MTVAVGPSNGVARASSAQDTALVLSSSHRPASSSAPLASSSQHLDDDVVQEFDATHRLSKLTAAWGNLAAGVTSFGEKLQVSFFEPLFVGHSTSSVLTSCFSFFCLCLFSLSLGTMLAYFSHLRPRKSYPLKSAS